MGLLGSADLESISRASHCRAAPSVSRMSFRKFDRSVSANVRSDFGGLLHTFVSGGKIPFPSRRDRSERRLGSMMISLAFLAPDLVNLKLGSLNLLMAELRKRGIGLRRRWASGPH
jgi:hypothetical protein